MSLQMGLDYHKEYRGEQSEETGLVFQSEQKKKIIVTLRCI